MESQTKDRRPLKSRDALIAKRLANWLTKRNVSPNFISLLSVGFALIGGTSYVALRFGYSTPLCLILAVVGIQGRLVCNLLDGMVAVEGKKGSAVGGLYNEVPDRVADSLIIVGAGYAIPHELLLPAIGWLAALLALFTAYIRTLGASLTGHHLFLGPMAKQQRMALMTGVSVIGCVVPKEWLSQLFYLALLVINFGCILTIKNRISLIAKELRSRC